MIWPLRYVLCFWIGPYTIGQELKDLRSIHTPIVAGLYLLVRRVSRYVSYHN